MKNMSLVRQPEIAALAFIAAIFALGVSVFKLYEGQRNILDAVLVQTALSELLSKVQDTETGQRGFLLTGDEEFLNPYNQSKPELHRKVAELRTLVSDNPKQMKALEEANVLIQERLFALERGIKAKLDGADHTQMLPRGRETMVQLRGVIAQMRSAEDNRLEDRRRSAARLLNVCLFVALITAPLAIYITFTWVQTARKSTEDLLQANAKLRAMAAARDGEESKVRQLQKMEAIGSLTGGIAHDFNNMLAVVLSALTMAIKRLAPHETVIDPAVPKLLAAGVDGAERAASLTKRLLAFSRQQALEPRELDVNRHILSMSELLTRTLGPEIVIEAVPGAGVWPTMVDPTALENAILNLAINARDAMPKGGKLTLETTNAFLDENYVEQNAETEVGQYVMVAVTDCGCGMSEEIQRKAFDPFFTTKEVGHGTGLGLSQVHGFVKQSRGHIKIYSEFGQGTTVKLYFPRYRATNRPEQVKEAPNPQLPLVHQNATILVVEDDPRVRPMTVAMLEELGYKTVEAENGPAALAILASRNDIDVVFTDIVMPGMGGKALALEVAKSHPDLPVLFTTGFTRNAVVHNGIVDEGVQLLLKPFTLEQLATRISRMLKARAAPT